MNQQIMTWELCIAFNAFENDDANIGILESLHQICPTNAHIGVGNNTTCVFLGPVDAV